MSMALQLDVEKRAATDLTNAKLDYSAPVVHFLLLLHIKLVAVASKLPAYSFCLGSMCIKIGHMIKLFFCAKRFARERAYSRECQRYNSSFLIANASVIISSEFCRRFSAKKLLTFDCTQCYLLI